VTVLQEGSAHASSGTDGDIAFASGAGSYADATGSDDYAAAYGTDSSAIAGGAGSSDDTAFFFGDDSTAFAGGTADNPGTFDGAIIAAITTPPTLAETRQVAVLTTSPMLKAIISGRPTRKARTTWPTSSSSTATGRPLPPLRPPTAPI
jgi:hypothetical protein